MSVQVSFNLVLVSRGMMHNTTLSSIMAGTLYTVARHRRLRYTIRIGDTALYILYIQHERVYDEGFSGFGESSSTMLLGSFQAKVTYLMMV